MIRPYRIMCTLVAFALVAMTGGCQNTGSGGAKANVLARITPLTNAVEGRWEMEKGRLVNEATAHARIALPVVPNGDYELSMRFLRLVGRNSANFVLPVGERHVLLTVGGWADEGGVSGLDQIDGKSSRDNITATDAFQIQNNRAYRLDVVVRTKGTDARIDVDVDGAPLIRWRGPQSALSLPPAWSLEPPATLAVGAVDSVLEIRTLTIRMLPSEPDWF